MVWDVKDIRIPADSPDQLTTNAKTAVPPIEFSITPNGDTNVIQIQDRQGVQGRVPTVSYRVYFLPKAFAPASTGTTATVEQSLVRDFNFRQAARKAASLVTEIAAPGLGTVLRHTDTDYVGQDGFYFCVAVNRSGVEAPSEHLLSTDSMYPAGTVFTPTSGGGSGPPPVVFTPSLETTYGAGLITGVVNGINTAFTMTQAFGTVDLVWVDGIFDGAATAVGVNLTVGTPPISFVAVEHVAP
jgi:hypothetical protein